MSSETAPEAELSTALSAATVSNKQRKRDTRKAEKAAKREQQKPAAEDPSPEKEQKPSAEDDPSAGNYGDVLPVPGEILPAAVPYGPWAEIGHLDRASVGRSVLVRGTAQAAYCGSKTKKVAFLELRQGMSTVQCVLAGSAQMALFALSLPKESVVFVEGAVALLDKPLRYTTVQEVEIQVRKLYCVSRAKPKLPISVEDAGRSAEEFAMAEANGVQLPRVGQDTRLNHPAINLRTPAVQAIFRIKHQIEHKFREYLSSRDFIGIHTPKLISGSSEGGAAVFKLEYKNGKTACLAQSPQLHKQMAICGGLRRVFEVGHIFRAEDSNTHRHLCEFVGMDAEMEIMRHYFEVCDIVDGFFVELFRHLNENCRTALEAVNRQYPFEPLKYLENTLRLSYEEGIQMLKEAGTEVEPMGDLNTEAERKLGQLVREKYDTDFFILYRYPLAARPFYTMPCYENPAYSNSFDVFLRGEEIISGAQRIHEPELLAKRVAEHGIDKSSIKSYLESFSYGTPPHGGFGIGLERVVKLFCGLDDIRMASLFPRDPQRLSP
ncbi:aspartate--tRNA ligase 2, cytoplasmic-like [Hordeum vulgare subsp. vulgare]|uniref:aspartate--tRNA ligase n=1 Tax=Hordeum vulgare subsp. vulgare TaxID=112509 RepID=A0A8I6Y0V7_HORVV|nr:aspartate--tRNA ligase 2, cytoplasmic-like [Hordeum vulgare subsp. vulgare]